MNNFTLIIPVFNRHEYLPFLFEEYKDVNKIFVESSSNPYPYPNGISYIICKDMLLQESLNEVLKHINTDFICWNNDDDIVSKPFLAEAVRFLNDNEGYSNVLGLQIKPNSTYGLSAFWSWYNNNYYSDDNEARVRFMMNFFHTPAHAVMKKQCLEDACSIPLKDNRLFPIKYFDRILGITQACHGNKKVIPYISLFRREDRMIDDLDYPKRLQREIPQNTMQKFFNGENELTNYLKSNNVNPKNINFKNKIDNITMLPTSDFKVTDPKLIKILQ